LCAELLSSWPDGRVKMYVTHRGLTLRRELRALFHSGSYDALAADGEHAEHIVALARRDDTEAVVAVVPRVAARLMRFAGEHPLGPAVWGDTRIKVDLPGLGGVYTDRFSGRRIATELRDGIPTLSVGALLSSLPVALLRRESTP